MSSSFEHVPTEGENFYPEHGVCSIEIDRKIAAEPDGTRDVIARW